MKTCPDQDKLAAFRDGQMDGAEYHSLAAHIESCDSCQKALSRCERDSRAETADTAPHIPRRVDLQDTVVTRSNPAAPSLQIPGYEIRARLGEGGMGIVYQAYHLKLRRLVALKMLRGDVDPESDHLQRFRHEAETIAALRHANIVQVFDVGEIDGKPFLSLEFIEGGSLDRRLRRDVYSVRGAVELVVKLAQAIHAAHERGIVHRDLKPANVLLTNDGTPKITDFGLAKPFEGEWQLTQTGEVVGTPSYMSPEQADSSFGRVQPATDVYALGAILYELCTGRPPFRGESVWQTLQMVVDQEVVPLRSVQPGLPRDLETICLKCLQKQQAQRYASARALADDLRRFLAGEPIFARPVGRVERVAKWTRRRPALAALGVVSSVSLTALVIGALWSNYQLRMSAQRERSATEGTEESRQRTRAVLDELAVVAEDLLSGAPHLEQERRKLLEKSVDYYRQVLEEQGDDPHLRLEAAVAHQRLGRIQQFLALSSDALGSYSNSIRLLEEAQKTAEAGPFQLELTHGYYGRGRVYAAMQQLDKAEADYSRALDILHAGCSDVPLQPEFMHEQSIVQNNLASIWSTSGKTDRAEKLWTAALEREQTLWEGDRQNVEYREQIATIASNLGVLYTNLQQVSDAERSLKISLNHYEHLSQSTSRQPEYREGVARAHADLGRLFQETNRPADARTAYRDALGIIESLIADFPSVPSYQHEASAAYNNLGNVAFFQQEFSEAETQFRRSIEYREPLIAQSPDVPAYRAALADTYNNLANLLRVHLGQPATAEEFLQKARAQYEELATRFSDVPDHHSGLAMATHNLSHVYADRGEFAEARALLKQAIVEARIAYAAGQENAFYRDSLSNSLWQYVATCVLEKDHASAAQGADAMASTFPNRWEEPQYAADFFFQCAELARQDETLTPEQRQELAESYDARGTAYVRQTLERGFQPEAAYFTSQVSRDKFNAIVVENNTENLEEE